MPPWANGVSRVFGCHLNKLILGHVFSALGFDWTPGEIVSG